MADGVIAVSEVCERTTSNSVVEINGRRGRVRVNLYVFDGLDYSPPANVPGDMRVRLRRIRHALKELPSAVKRRGGDFPATYAAEWRHLIDSINRDTAVDCTLEDGRRATQIMLAAVESRSRGRPVKVVEAPRRITPTGSSMQ
jgi:predicted dehydrogenase